MKRSLLAQVYPTYITTVVACLVALAIVATTLVRSFVYETVKLELADMISVAERSLYPNGTSAMETGAADEVTRLFGGMQVRLTVIAPDGLVIADSKWRPQDMENHADRPEVVAALKIGEGSATRRSETIGAELLYHARPVIRNGAVIAVIRTAMPLPFLQNKLTAFYAQLGLGGLFILSSAAALAFATVRRISKPLISLGIAARRFGAGDLDYRSRVVEPEEIRVLSETMNSMAGELRERIEDVERRRREAEVVFSGMAEGVVVLNRDLRISKTNDSALRLLPTADGMDPVGRTLLEAFRATDLQRFAKQAMATGLPVEENITIYSETPRYLQVYAAEIPGREGGGCLLVVHDITRLIQLENVRKDFVANVSHELKTPITAIKGFVETLSDGALEDPVQGRRFLDIIARHATRLGDIVDDLLALASIEQQEGLPLETEMVSVLGLLEDVRIVCAYKADEKRIDVAISCPGNLEMRSAPTLVEQALVNLLDNAIKYSEEATSIRMEAVRDGEEIEIRVIDQGRGIPAKDLPRIFERFYRVDKARSRNAGGTGLGLAIVKHVAAIHGGSVSVESWEGAGSTFSIRLPIDPPRGRALGPKARDALL